MAVFAAPAQSDTILGCGSVVAESVVLDNDIGPCPADGLVIPGGAVTVDLNGHTISGSSGSGVGIRISSDPSPEQPVEALDVTVTNGSVKGFDVGVVIFVGSNGCPPPSVITVDKLRIQANGRGVSIFGDPPCRATVNVTRNTIARNAGDGIWAGVLKPIQIVGNQIVRNGGMGIQGTVDSVRQVDDNYVARNGGDGINLKETVSMVRRNSILRNGGVGLVIRESLASFIPLYEVADNVARRNAAGGMIASALIDLPPGPPAGSGNVAKKNGNFQCVLIKCAAKPG